MENNNELKPCPFCGGKAKLEFDDEACYHGGRGLDFVECKKCHAKSALADSEIEAITLWNNRATEEQKE